MRFLKYSDLRNKFLLVLFFFAIYKVGTYIAVPGVNRDLLGDLMASSSALGFANMFSGGALANFSIFAIGIMPYITASIIVQLLAMDIVPILSEWRRQGEDGNKKTKKLTYQLTLVFAIVQSISLSLGFNKLMPGVVSEPSFGTYALISICLTFGTVLLLIFSEIIEKKGIGKGVSMIILAGILMTVPTSIYQYVISEKGETWTDFTFIVETIILLIVLFGVMLFIIQVQRGERRLPVTYTSHANGKTNKTTNHLPIKLNSAGVIPVIFAMSLFMTPTTIAMMFPESSVSQWITGNVTYQSAVGMAIYALLIFGFTYFYAFVTVNPEKVAENLQKSGGYMPGVRPGKETEYKIRHVLKHLTFAGALFLAAIAVLPIIILNVAQLPQSIQIGGTSLIIVVSALVDVKSQVGTDTLRKQYKGFIKK